jgi:3-deoxy-D-arabino-heptulosonate 7-phosphate (DAHP) synthase
VDRSDIVDTVQGGTRVRELMIAQLESRHMPLAPETIGEEARMDLLSWLYTGAYAVESQSCAADDASSDQMTQHEEESE